MSQRRHLREVVPVVQAPAEQRMCLVCGKAPRRRPDVAYCASARCQARWKRFMAQSFAGRES